MTTRLSVIVALISLLYQSQDVAESAAQQPGWSPVIIATGQYRQQIKSLPIEQRPYRPFHFYGNSIRRSYHGGAPTPFGALTRGPYESRLQTYSAARPVLSSPTRSPYAPPAYRARPVVRLASPVGN